MNEEKDEYKGLYYNNYNNNNEYEEHNFEYGAHFKYEELCKKLFDLAKERNKVNNNSNKKDRINGNNNVLKGISRNKINNNDNNKGENILNYLKNLNHINLSQNNESFKSVSYNKINEKKINILSNKNTINNTRNIRTIVKNSLFQNINKKYFYIFENNKHYNTKNSSSNKKLNNKILNVDKSFKDISIQHKKRNISKSRKNNLNNIISQIQSNKIKFQIKHYFDEKYSKIFSNFNSFNKVSPNKKNNNETINKKNSFPKSRNNNILSMKKIKEI